MVARMLDAADVQLMRSGDFLSKEEFHRRYSAMPNITKAELIEGIVYVPSPLRIDNHGDADQAVAGWLHVYRAQTPGTQGGSNSSVFLEVGENNPQPDQLLRIRPEFGGKSRTAGGFVEGSPELVLEIAASSVSYDCHQKYRAYELNGIDEYVIWRVEDEAIDWFRWVAGKYVRLQPDDQGVYRSVVFPGLWLDAPAMLASNHHQVLATLQRGLATPEHQTFIAKLAAAEQPAR